MKLLIVAVGHRMPGWIADGFREYAQRMPPELRLELREIKPEARTANRATDAIMAAERQRIEAALPKDARLVALDERGRDWSTQQLAEALPQWQRDARDVAFVIGGADGLASDLVKRAQLVLSFGAMTWPHMLARAMLLEQLYRASAILAGHPYHRGD